MALPYARGGVLAPYHEKPHLFVVMNEPCEDGQCLLLMVTTIYEGRRHDPACILNDGDHPFIVHPSYVAYRIAQRTAAQHVKNMLAKKLYLQKEDFEASVFARIAKGLFDSEDVSGGTRRYAALVGLDEYG